MSHMTREKMLKIKFLSKRYSLVANFTLEKKKLRRTLAEQAAEVVARMVDDAEELEIPETLRPVVREQQQVRSGNSLTMMMIMLCHMSVSRPGEWQLSLVTLVTSTRAQSQASAIFLFALHRSFVLFIVDF